MKTKLVQSLMSKVQRLAFLGDKLHPGLVIRRTAAGMEAMETRILRLAVNALVLPCMWLQGDKKRSAWGFGIAAQVCYTIFALITGQWYQYFPIGLKIWLNIRGWRKWKTSGTIPHDANSRHI